jgi:hypothetical protein
MYIEHISTKLRIEDLMTKILQVKWYKSHVEYLRFINSLCTKFISNWFIDIKLLL